MIITVSGIHLDRNDNGLMKHIQIAVKSAKSKSQLKYNDSYNSIIILYRSLDTHQLKKTTLVRGSFHK